LNIAFRVDASSDIGIGHLMRCLALSEELIKRGHICYFLTKINDDELIDIMKKNNISHQKVKIAATLEEDLDFLINFSNEKDINWVITDHYDLTTQYIQRIKQNNLKVLSIDDTALIHYYSDIVLNQNIGSDKLNFSAEGYTKFLLGPKYAIIRNELLKNEQRTERDTVKKILIMLGGTDKDNFTLKILESLKSFIKNLEFKVVIGPLNPFYNDIKKYIKEESLKIKLIKSPENIADLYLDSDIAISAGGTTCYELAYFGIPNIIITIADNQVNIARELDKQKVSVYLGKKEEVKAKQLKNKFNELVNNHSLQKNISQNGKKMVDGNGKERIVDFMEKFS